ncbi:MAG: hypothetical protein K8R60_02230 [Burkholderiales bacterium]|nr:hypothetical protein [Burkholderiales bacterium]
MKRFTVAAGLIASCSWAQADPGFMLGLSYNFGGSLGVTAKILSTNKQEKAVAALGVSYMFGEAKSKFGVDLGAGYNFKNDVTATVGWDFMNSQVQTAVGVASTKKKKDSSAPPTNPSGSGSSVSLDRFLADSPSSL